MNKILTFSKANISFAASGMLAIATLVAVATTGTSLWFACLFGSALFSLILGKKLQAEEEN